MLIKYKLIVKLCQCIFIMYLVIENEYLLFENRQKGKWKIPEIVSGYRVEKKLKQLSPSHGRL